MSERRAKLDALAGLLTEPGRSSVRAALAGFARGVFEGDPLARALRARPDLAPLVVLAAIEAAEWKLGGAVAIRPASRAGFVVRAFPEDKAAGLVLVRAPAASAAERRWRLYVAWAVEDAPPAGLAEGVRVFARMLEVFSGVPVDVREVAQPPGM